MEFFIRSDTDIYLSCSARLNGEYYVFGGNQRTPYTDFTKQISKINDCRLKRVGDLPFDFEYGACGTYEVSSEERVMLCFDMNEQRKCRRYSEFRLGDSPLTPLFSYSGFDFDTHPDSAWPHTHTTLGNVNNLVIAVGDWQSKNIQVEQFNIATNSWSTRAPYPYCSKT